MAAEEREQVYELTARCIVNNDDWLEMAVMVHKAIPLIFHKLVGKTWEGVGKRIEKECNVEVERYSKPHDDPYYGFKFKPNAGCEFFLCAGTWPVIKAKPQDAGPVFSLYRDDSSMDDKQLEDVKSRFITALEEDRYGDSWPEGDYVANVCVGYRVWDCWRVYDAFEDMVKNRKEVECRLADLLCRVSQSLV